MFAEASFILRIDFFLGGNTVLHLGWFPRAEFSYLIYLGWLSENHEHLTRNFGRMWRFAKVLEEAVNVDVL